MTARRLGFHREHTGDRAADAIQSDRDRIAKTLNAFPFARGKLISVDLTGGVGTTINHGLGTPAACYIVRPNYDGSGNVVRIAESGTAYQAALDLNNQLSIVADVSGLLDLWFYPRASKVIPTGAVQS